MKAEVGPDATDSIIVITTITDTPRGGKEVDKFGLEPYEKGLEAFLRGASTPITIALQGEWGSGKTSLMNVLQENLCTPQNNPSDSEKEFYSIWINTWEFALMKDSQEVLTQILLKIINQIIALTKPEKSVADSITKGVVGIGAAVIRAVADKYLISGVGDGIRDALAKSESSNISELRERLQEQIDRVIKQAGERKKGIIFFIDDLDRIDPPVAVELLELLKNLFTLDGCIFVLAIDYDVVIKGLKPKYGELTEKNEREFRSFFDKIIQVPFSMPVSQYRIDDYLFEALMQIGILDSSDLKEDKKLKDDLREVVMNSIGFNPRSLKRFLNTLSLIKCISQAGEGSPDGHKNISVGLSIYLNFAIVAIQVAYPKIYRILCKNAEFTSWRDSDVQEMGIPPLNEEVRNRLSFHEEFDEEWEQVLYRICLTDKYLENNAFKISKLFNAIINKISEEESVSGDAASIEDTQSHDIGKYLLDQINLTSVTGLTPNDMSPLKYDNKKLIDTVIQHILSGLTKAFTNARFKSSSVRTGSHGQISEVGTNIQFNIQQSAPQNHQIMFKIMIGKVGLSLSDYRSFAPKGGLPNRVYIDEDLFRMREKEEYDVSRFNAFFEMADRLKSDSSAYNFWTNRRIVNPYNDKSREPLICFTLQLWVTFNDPDSFTEDQAVRNIQEMTCVMYDTIRKLG